MPGKCKFQDEWLDDDRYKGWIERVFGNQYSARCRVCKKNIEIANMGESALRSHLTGTKHKSLMSVGTSSVSIKDFMTPNMAKSPVPSGGNVTVSKCVSSSSSVVVSVASLASKTEHLRSEILWTLNVITKHESYKSSEGMSEIFRAMFPDSEIAQHFSCGERKCAYLCTFGLAPYFQQQLKDSCRDTDSFVLLFDESLNKKTKNKQMDIWVRPWNEDHVVSRYYNSVFMGHGTAIDMAEHFAQGTDNMNMRKLLQLSMDGPNVNWKFYNTLREQLKTEFSHELLNIGSCGLHIVHGAFKDGALETGWAIQKLLSSLYYLFKDTPARREDFESVTKSKVFPLKFCPHRWVENVLVAQRAVTIWPSIKLYIDNVATGKLPSPSTTSFDIVKGSCKDPLIIAKLQFFISVASQVETFLKLYQTDRPMTPFLGQDLYRCLKGLFKRFVKKEVMAANDSVAKLIRLDPDKTEDYCSISRLNVGFAVEDELKSLVSKKRVSERQLLEFRNECRKFLVKIVKKLLLKSPLKYPVVRQLACLDPKLMADDRDGAVTLMKKLLHSLADIKRVQLSDCDDILRSYEEFLDVIVAANMSVFTKFDSSSPTCRVDELLSQHMGKHASSHKLWFGVVKPLLLLSHGQATVERGFSVNKEVEVENLLEQSFIAQRVICDHVLSVGGILKVKITNQLLVYASNARSKYMNYLEENRKLKLKEDGLRKRKGVLEEIEGLKKKQKLMDKEITELIDSADKLADKAEHCGKLIFVTQSNSLRHTAKTKREQLKQIAEQLEEKVQSLKN